MLSCERHRRRHPVLNLTLGRLCFAAVPSQGLWSSHTSTVRRQPHCLPDSRVAPWSLPNLSPGSLEDVLQIRGEKTPWIRRQLLQPLMMQDNRSQPLTTPHIEVADAHCCAHAPQKHGLSHRHVPGSIRKVVEGICTRLPQREDCSAQPRQLQLGHASKKPI